MGTAIGIIIARFQTPFLHEGHKNLIEQVMEKHNRTGIVLGTQPVRGSLRNPYDYPTRERMLHAEFPGISVLPLADRYSDVAWSIALDKLLQEAFPGEQCILYGSRDSFIPCYSGKNKVVELPEAAQVSATLLREQLQDCVRESEDFRRGILYAHSRLYPAVFATVDIALRREGQLLLVRKPEEKGWRLPGGFSDPTDANFEAAARRELIEECGELEFSTLSYEGSFAIDDWRYQREQNAIISLLFSAEYNYGKLCPQDDIAEASWFSFEEIIQMKQTGELHEAHLPLLDRLIQKYAPAAEAVS